MIWLDSINYQITLTKNNIKMARYKVTKEQLERIVENFVMEASIESKKTPVKDMIPSQGAEAKKHVKNKMSGNMVDHSEGMPSVTPMKKKLSQAADAKKHMSKAKASHTTKTKVVKEEVITENILSDIYNMLGGSDVITIGGDAVEKGTAVLMMIGTLLGAGTLYFTAKNSGKKKSSKNKPKDNPKGKSDFMDDEEFDSQVKKIAEKNKAMVIQKVDAISKKLFNKDFKSLDSNEKKQMAQELLKVAEEVA